MRARTSLWRMHSIYRSATCGITADGDGHVGYTRKFEAGETEVWLIATLAGGAIEREVYGTCYRERDLELDLSITQLARCATPRA